MKNRSFYIVMPIIFIIIAIVSIFGYIDYGKNFVIGMILTSILGLLLFIIKHIILIYIGKYFFEDINNYYIINIINISLYFLFHLIEGDYFNETIMGFSIMWIMLSYAEYIFKSNQVEKKELEEWKLMIQI